MNVPWVFPTCSSTMTENASPLTSTGQLRAVPTLEYVIVAYMFARFLRESTDRYTAAE